MKLTSSVSRLRIISLIDACSYLYLLFAAYFLRDVLGIANTVRIPGMIHGILFALFGLALLNAWIVKKWSFKTVFLVFLTCLVPLVPFWLEGWLKKQDN